MRLTRRTALTPLWAVAFQLAAPGGARAQATTSMSATGSSALGAGAAVDYSRGGSAAGAVDLLAVDDDGTNSARLHSYGSSAGDFGSRASGRGTYDVSGSYVIRTVFANPFTSAQNITFNFYVTPGYLQTYAPAAAGADFVSAGISFVITRDGVTKFSSDATLTTTASGTTFVQHGADLYTAGAAPFGAAPTNYNIEGGPISVDLGMLDAGASLTIEYTLSTFARGDVAARTFDVPGQTLYRPDQLVPCAAGAAALCTPSALAGDSVYVLPSADVTGPGSSFASSGDPFDFDANGRIVGLRDETPGVPGVTPFAPTAVTAPEPATLGLTLTGLGVLALAARRRRRGQRPVDGNSRSTPSSLTG